MYANRLGRFLANNIQYSNFFQVSEVKNVDKKTASRTTKSKTSSVSKESSSGFDPLSNMGPLGSALDGLDPLSAMAIQSSSAPSKGRGSSFGVSYFKVSNFCMCTHYCSTALLPQIISKLTLYQFFFPCFYLLKAH